MVFTDKKIIPGLYRNLVVPARQAPGMPTVVAWRVDGPNRYSFTTETEVTWHDGADYALRVHTIKCAGHYFKGLASGSKRWELRKNDRRYFVGDWLRIVNRDADRCEEGRPFERDILLAEVTGVSAPDGLSEGYVILDIAFAKEGALYDVAQKSAPAVSVAVSVESIAAIEGLTAEGDGVTHGDTPHPGDAVPAGEKVIIYGLGVATCLGFRKDVPDPSVIFQHHGSGRYATVRAVNLPAALEDGLVVRVPQDVW